MSSVRDNEGLSLLGLIMGLALASTMLVGSFTIIEQLQRVEASNDLRQTMTDLRNSTVMYAFRNGSPPACTEMLLGRRCEDGQKIEGARSYIDLTSSRFEAGDVTIEPGKRGFRAHITINVSPGLADVVAENSLSLTRAPEGVATTVLTSSIPEGLKKKTQLTSKELKNSEANRVELRDQYFRYPFTENSDIRNFKSAFEDDVPSDWRWRWEDSGGDFLPHKPGYPDYVRNLGPPISHCGHFTDRAANKSRSYYPASIFYDRHANRQSQSTLFEHCFKDRYQPARALSSAHMEHLLDQGYSKNVLLKITAQFEGGRVRLTRNFPTPQVTEGDGGVDSSSVGRYVRGQNNTQIHSWHRLNAQELEEASRDDPVIARASENISAHRTFSRTGADHFPNVPPWDGILFEQWQDQWHPDPRFWTNHSESIGTALQRTPGRNDSEALGIRYALWYEGGTEDKPGSLYIQYRQDGDRAAAYAFREVDIESTRGGWHRHELTWNDGSQPNVNGPRGIGHVQVKTNLVLMPKNEDVESTFKKGSKSVQVQIQEAEREEARLEEEFNIDDGTEKNAEESSSTAEDEESGIAFEWTTARARPGVQRGDIDWSDPLKLADGSWTRFLAGVGQSITDTINNEFFVLSNEHQGNEDFLHFIEQPGGNDGELQQGAVEWGNFCIETENAVQNVNEEDGTVKNITVSDGREEFAYTVNGENILDIKALVDNDHKWMRFTADQPAGAEAVYEHSKDGQSSIGTVFEQKNMEVQLNGSSEPASARPLFDYPVDGPITGTLGASASSVWSDDNEVHGLRIQKTTIDENNSGPMGGDLFVAGETNDGPTSQIYCSNYAEGQKQPAFSKGPTITGLPGFSDASTFNLPGTRGFFVAGDGAVYAAFPQSVDDWQSNRLDLTGSGEELYNVDFARGDFNNDQSDELLISGTTEPSIAFDNAHGQSGEGRLYMVMNPQATAEGADPTVKSFNEGGSLRLEYWGGRARPNPSGAFTGGIGGSFVKAVDLPPRSYDGSETVDPEQADGTEFIIAGEAQTQQASDARQEERTFFAVVDYRPDADGFRFDHHPAGSHIGVEPASNPDAAVGDLNGNGVPDLIFCGQLTGTRASSVKAYYYDTTSRKYKTVNAFLGSLNNCSISMADFGPGEPPEGESLLNEDYKGDGDLDAVVSGFNSSRDRTQINTYRNQLQ